MVQTLVEIRSVKRGNGAAVIHRGEVSKDNKKDDNSNHDDSDDMIIMIKMIE